MTRRRSFWAWGYEGEGLDADERAGLGAAIAARLGTAELAPLSPPSLDGLALPPPRLSPPGSLTILTTNDPRERAGHTYGKAFRDLMRGMAGDFAHAPDLVAFPGREEDVRELLDFCASERLAAIPYGAGSSVVGGVEARLDGDFRGAVSIDLSRLDRVLEVDPVSRAARIQAGMYGPAIEAALRPHGLSLRHYPQSFELSTLGGWIATRSGGHYATLHTHIDDFVEALRVVTPRGTIATRRLPASGAGPQPERLFLGSEGALGIITEAWMRLQARPRFRASATVRFAEFARAAEAARQVAQSGLYPSNCRVLDAAEAQNNFVGDGTRHLLLLGFESHDHPLDAPMQRALEIARSAGGEHREGAGRTVESTGDDDGEGRDEAAGAWRRMFLRGPYLRDALVQLGLIVETFETAITWDRFDEFHASVMEATRDALARTTGGGLVTCRITHVYPDGAAPYYTVLAPARPGSPPAARIAQWDEIKAAVSGALIDAGGTITHHHAVGRDHRRSYEVEVPALHREALSAAKRSLDPDGVLNPGVLV